MMSALVEDPAARDDRVDAIMVDSDRYDLEAAVKTIESMNEHLRQGSTATDTIADMLECAKRDVQRVLDRMNAREARR